MKRIIIILLALFIAGELNAEEVIELKSLYPSPYGNYQELNIIREILNPSICMPAYGPTNFPIFSFQKAQKTFLKPDDIKGTEQIGSLNFDGWYNKKFNTVASISAFFTGSNLNYGGDILFSTKPENSTNPPEERVRITDHGEVRIIGGKLTAIVDYGKVGKLALRPVLTDENTICIRGPGRIEADIPGVQVNLRPYVKDIVNANTITIQITCKGKIFDIFSVEERDISDDNFTVIRVGLNMLKDFQYPVEFYWEFKAELKDSVIEGFDPERP